MRAARSAAGASSGSRTRTSRCGCSARTGIRTTTASARSGGKIAGLLGGTAAMGAILAFAFDAQRSILKVIAALFVLNAAGYFLGGWFEGKLAIHHRLAAMLLWGVCYGLGFGAGLGLAFHICQTRARAALGGR